MTETQTIRDAKRLLTQKELSQQIGIAGPTLEKWRWLGKGPRFIKVGRLVKYRQEDVDLWIEQNTQGAS